MIPEHMTTAPVRRDALRRRGLHFAGALLLSGLTTLLAFPLQQLFETSNIVMLFLLCTVAVAVMFGRAPAVLAAIVNVLAFDWFFVPPRFTFVVADAQYLFTFAVMLVVGLVVGQLTAGLRHEADAASQGEERSRGLFEMARELSGALAPEQVKAIGERFVAAAVQGAASVLALGEDETLAPPCAQASSHIDMAVARSCAETGAALPTPVADDASLRMLYLPLRAPVRTRGVLVISAHDPDALDLPEQRRWLETAAALIAIALERVHFVAVAQRKSLEMESERLRNSMLSALSHDLRTPLTALVGVSDALATKLSRDPALRYAQEDAIAIRDQARRTALLVDNLLEMARFESGRVSIRRDWQSMEELIGAALTWLDEPLRDHDVLIDVPDDLPLVSCDGVLVGRVIFNLLENAAKYTPSGTPIRVAAARRDGTIEVAVEDRGRGLPRGRERAIFDKFTRGESESAVPGVGLGLAICRAIVEAHGGTIRAENRPEGGARFVFTLPSTEPPAVPSEVEPTDA